MIYKNLLLVNPDIKISQDKYLNEMCIRDRRTVDRRCLRPEDVSNDEKRSRTIKNYSS